VCIHQHTSAYVSIRQAYVSIRQHTSAYVSIRQHTSAYGSMHLREHSRLELLHRLLCGLLRYSTCGQPLAPAQLRPLHTPASVSIRQPPPLLYMRPAVGSSSAATTAYATIRQHTSASSAALHAASRWLQLSCDHCIRHHTSACVGRCPHMKHASAYVSIRQHTSAYGPA
jgi:hypothetical protein